METKARYALIGLFTLCVIVAGFAFVYWLHHAGGMGKRAEYRVRFDSSVSGLLSGSGVLFNGIRVGEVARLELNPEQPKQVLATIAVDPSTPIRRDTAVGLDFQGLTGAPVIVLTGGTAASPALVSEGGAAPLLVAPPDAGQTLTQSARNALNQVDKIMGENSAPLRDAIGNISTFSQVLARNSDRIDGILAGLERMTGGAAAKAKVPMHSLMASGDVPACQHPLNVQIVVPEPAAAISLASDKIPIEGAPADPAAFETARFSDNVPPLLHAKFIEALENSHCFKAVTRVIEGLEADLQVIIDVRAFRILVAEDSVADLDFSAKVVTNKGKVAGAQVFHERTPLATADGAGAMGALDTAYGKVLHAFVPWVARVAAQAPRAAEAVEQPAKNGP